MDHVSVGREDLKRVVAHCRNTWKPSEPGYDAVTRCQFALGHRLGYVNLFRIDSRLAPSITYDTREEAERYCNATSFVQTIEISISPEE